MLLQLGRKRIVKYPSGDIDLSIIFNSCRTIGMCCLEPLNTHGTEYVGGPWVWVGVLVCAV